MTRVAKLGFVLIVGAVMLACASAPVDEIAQAENALRAARDSGARDCAPRSFRSAEEMMARAYRLSDEKEYDEAKKTAETTRELAEVAKNESDKARAAGRCKPAEVTDSVEDDAAASGDGARLGGATLSEADVREEIARIQTGEGSLGEGTRVTALKPVYFNFDDSGVSGEALQTIQENAEWLEQRPTVKVQVEGHTDERGTAEYNLALGERRAKAVRDALTRLGIAVDRISVISYGEEAPANLGTGEASWKENRRAEFVIQ